MATIKILDLRSQSVDRIQTEDLPEAVSDSVARAIKARGNAEDSKIMGRILPPITLGIIAYPPILVDKPLG